MGQQETKQSSVHVENVPYTTFSVPKNDLQKPQITTKSFLQTFTANQKKKEEEQDDGIVSVITQNDLQERGEISVNDTVDPLLQEMNRIPSFEPLIKSSVSESVWKELFKDKNESIQHLGKKMKQFFN